MSSGLVVVGYGKMGRLVEQLAPSLGFEVCARINGARNPAGARLSRESLAGADVAIDFSTPEAAPENILRLAWASTSYAAPRAGTTPCRG